MVHPRRGAAAGPGRGLAPAGRYKGGPANVRVRRGRFDLNRPRAYYTAASEASGPEALSALSTSIAPRRLANPSDKIDARL